MTTPIEAPPLEVHALTEAFSQFIRSLKQHRSTRDSTDHGVAIVLFMLKFGGPLRPSELARSAGLDLSTVSRHVRSLESAGHLTRTDDPDDRRAFRVALTELGRQHVEDLERERTARFAEVVADWPVEDVASLTRLLVRLRESFEATICSSDER
jgi:DNA-binding MarR family transcriptional regulator